MFVKTTCSIPGVAFVGGGNEYGILWRNQAAGLWCWYDNHQGKWVISSQIGYRMQSQAPYSYQFNTNFLLFNGQAYWTSSSSQHVIWYGGGSVGWCMTFNVLGFGNMEWLIGEPRYGGDEWWSCNTMSGTYIPRGRIKNSGNNIVVNAPVLKAGTYWVKNGAGQANPFGDYTNPVDGGSTKTIGLLRMKSGDTMFLQNKIDDVSGGFGSIQYAEPNKWVIGTYQSDQGWFEFNGVFSLLPWNSNKTPVTFVNMKTEDGEYVLISEEKAADIAVSFDSYIQGNGTAKFYLCEAVQWRNPLTVEEA